MKNIKKLVIVTVLALAVCGLAFAQVHRTGALNHNMALNHGDAASVVQHLAEIFPQIATFDANKDGKLDATEKEALGKAIADGTVQFPAHTAPPGLKPTGEMMLNHIAEMYAYVARYDSNQDGELDETEQAAIKSAIEKGKFALHGQHPHAGAFHD